MENSSGKQNSNLASSQNRLRSKQCDISGRVFAIDLLMMSNGCFVSLSEDANSKMGAITLSVRSDRGVGSSTLIPDRRGSIFASMLGEMLAEKTKGIAVTSLYLREELDPDSMKTLLNEVRKLAE